MILPVTNFRVTGATVNSISLAWSNGMTYDSIVVYGKLTGGSFAPLDTISGSATSYNATDLQSGKKYYFYIVAFKDEEFTSPAAVYSSTLLSPPTGVTVSAADEDTLNVGWSNALAYYTNVLVEYQKAGESVWTTVSLAGSAEGTAINGLTEGQRYSVRIRAYLGSPHGTYSAYTSTVTEETVLGAPSGLSATVKSATKVDLAWTNNGTYSYVDIYRKVGSGGTYALLVSKGPTATSHSDMTCSEGVQYYYALKGRNAYTTSAYSNVAGALTTYPAPSLLTGTAISASSIRWEWQDNTDDETGFKLYVNDDAPVILGANVKTHDSTGLTYGQRYTAYIVAYKTGVTSPKSNYCTVLMATAPAAPSALVVVPVSALALMLRFTDNANNELDFHIEESADGSTGWSEIATVGANVTTYERTELSSDTLKYYRVRAHNDSGYSGYCAVASGRTMAAIAAPTGLVVNSFSGTEAEVFFNDNSTDEDAHVVERKVSGGSFSVVKTLAPNVTYWKDPNLTPGGTYIYRVRAQQGANYSGYSNEVTIQTLQVPNAPSSIVEDEKTDTTTRLTWTAPTYAANKPVSGYKVEKSTDGGANYSLVQKIYTGVCEYLVQGLIANTAYKFRVCAFNAAGDGAYCAAIDVTTVAQYEETKLQKYLRRTSINPIYLLELLLKKTVSGFAQVSGGTYAYEHTVMDDRIIITSACENGEELTVAISAAAVESAAGSWYFDNAARKFYIHTTGGDPPANYLIEAGFTVGIQNYAADTHGNVWNGQQYLVIASAANMANIQSGVGDNYAGSFVSSNGTFTVINPLLGNKEYFWDKKFARWTFLGSRFRILLGVPGFEYSDFKPIEAGVIDKVNLTDGNIEINYIDARDGMKRSLPINHYWQSEWPLMTDTGGPSKAILYGTVTDAPLVCLDVTSRRYGYHDGRCGGIAALKINGTTKTAGTDYYDDPWHGIVTLSKTLTLVDGDIITVDFNGILQGDNTLIENPIAAWRDIVIGYLDQKEESDINRDLTYAAERACTTGISLYLPSETDSESIFRRIEAGNRAFILKDLQGRLGIRMISSTAGSDVRYVQEHMLTNYSQEVDRSQLYYKIEVRYSYDGAGNYQTVEKILNSIRWKNGVLETLVVETCLDSAMDAQSVLNDIEAKMGKGKVNFTAPLYLIEILPGAVIKFTRRRFFDEQGTAAEKEILILKSDRSLGSALGVGMAGEAV